MMKTMKIVILNSGYARRLKPLTDNTHKSLLKVQGKTILERQIASFIAYGFNSFLITTGPFEDQIMQLIATKFPSIDVTYVKNPKFESTNYIYSMWLARKEMENEDLILLHGDLVYQKSVIKKIINQKRSSVIIDSNAPLPEKDFKGLIENDTITKIGLDIFGPKAAFLLPLYYWIKEDFAKWMEQINLYVEKNEVKCYAENAFNDISNNIPLFPVDLDNEFCMEIDTLEDLNKANEIAKE